MPPPRRRIDVRHALPEALARRLGRSHRRARRRTPWLQGVVPVHLDGPRRLYRWWSWPRVTVTVGAPILVERDPAPSRERSQATADRVLAAIRALEPAAG